MKKTFELEDLDCANCAMKMQEAILKIPALRAAKLTLLSRR